MQHLHRGQLQIGQKAGIAERRENLFGDRVIWFTSLRLEMT
jgi:hypothetical protein